MAVVTATSSLARRAYRRVYWAPRDVRALCRARFPSHLIYFGGTGFGDDLLLASVLHELHRRGHRRLAVITRLVEIFEHAPFVDRVLNEDWAVLEAMLRWRVGRTVKPHYYVGFRAPDTDITSRGHIIAEMCRQAGLSGPVALRTYLHLRPDERVAGRICERQAAIQCMAPSSVNASANKIWFSERYQEVVDQNRDRLQFVQLGSEKDPLLHGVIDLRGRTSIRHSAAILANSSVFVGYVGFLMHLARAVDTRGVVIFGGREHPDQSGYVCNENLFTALPCSPCWRRTTCDYNRECMRRITASDVTAAITRVLAHNGAPLETATEDIPPGPRCHERSLSPIASAS